MENNANTIETILYPLSSGTENPTMLRIEIEYIPLENLKSAWHYTLIDQSQESTGYSLSAAETPPITSKTADGHTWLKTFAFLFSSDGTTGQFTEVRHTFTELPADPVQLLLLGEKDKSDAQNTSVVDIWLKFIKGLKKEVLPKQEISTALVEALRESGNLN